MAETKNKNIGIMIAIAIIVIAAIVYFTQQKPADKVVEKEEVVGPSHQRNGVRVVVVDFALSNGVELLDSPPIIASRADIVPAVSFLRD